MEEDEGESGVRRVPDITVRRELIARLIDRVCSVVVFRVPSVPIPRPRLTDIMLVTVDQMLGRANMMVTRSALSLLDFLPVKVSAGILDSLIAFKRLILKWGHSSNG